jgi:hypothetical protein
VTQVIASSASSPRQQIASTWPFVTKGEGWKPPQRFYCVYECIMGGLTSACFMLKTIESISTKFDVGNPTVCKNLISILIGPCACSYINMTYRNKYPQHNFWIVRFMIFVWNKFQCDEWHERQENNLYLRIHSKNMKHGWLKIIRTLFAKKKYQSQQCGVQNRTELFCEIYVYSSEIFRSSLLQKQK